MKVIYVLTIVLLSATLSQVQENIAPRRTPDDAYTPKLVRLITGLQKNPWQNWASGTEVVVRYLVDYDAAGIPPGHAQPDIVYRVIEADKLLSTTQVYKGKTIRRDFMIKDQPGLDAAWARLADGTSPSTTELEVDGFKLSCLLSELSVHEFPGGTRVTRQWTLASHPSIVLRSELVGGSGWNVTSPRVMKKIGEREFSCVEIKKWMRFYSQGPNDAMTIQYLCPDVPGHLVEERQEFFKVKKGQRSSTPFQVVHLKVVELKLQEGGNSWNVIRD
jgi:hypothetical protein